MPGHVDSVHDHRACVHREHAFDGLEDRGLARSVRSKQSQDLAAADLEAHPTDGVQRPVPLLQAGDGYQRWRVRSVGSRTGGCGTHIDHGSEYGPLVGHLEVPAVSDQALLLSRRFAPPVT